MQAGIRAWILRATSGRSLREISPPVLLSLLCAAAFCPLVVTGVGIAGLTGAGFSVLSSVGGGILTEVLTRAIDHLRPHDGKPGAAPAELEREIARQLQHVLAAEDTNAQAMLAEIGAVLKEIGTGEIALQAAIETGNEHVRNDVIAAISALGLNFTQLEFLINDVTRALAGIQRSLDEQATGIRVVTDQVAQQSVEVRQMREEFLADSRSRAFLAAADGAAGGEVRANWTRRCPYRGLMPFREADAEVFYGRERMTTELAVKVARQLARPGLVVVTGASGAGKSSLLRAGLLPALARGMQVEGSEYWPRTVIAPTGDPLSELAAHLTVVDRGDAIATREQLARNPEQAHLIVQRTVLAYAARLSDGPSPSFPDNGRLVLVVDQFEQLFTLNADANGEQGRQAFITALCAIAKNPAGPDGKPPAVVVIAVRGDFWDRCAAYPVLASELQEGQFVVEPMTETDLRLAITGPAGAAGLHIDRALTDTIVSDLRVAGGDNAVGALPLLSQAMLLTWENREGDRLTSHGYDRAGGVSLAVQTSADVVYDQLSAQQQALAREMLRSMTVASRGRGLTRRPVTHADLYAACPDAEPPEVDAVLEAFAEKRLVVLDDRTAQISHDALLAAWPRLRGWLADDQASWILHDQFADDVAAWRDSKDDSSFLYRGTQLAILGQAVARWSTNAGRYPALTDTQQRFLHASERAAARSALQRRILAASLVLLLIASLAGAGFAIAAANNANQQRSLAISAQLSAQSEELGSTNPVLAALLSAAAWRMAPTSQARESMLEAYARPERALLTTSRSRSSNAVAFSPDGKTLATVGSDARLWNVATRSQMGNPIAVSNSDMEGAAFSPDGRILATASDDGVARLWNVATHHQIGSTSVTSVSASLTGVAFSPGGKTIATANGDGTLAFWSVATSAEIGAPIPVSPYGVQGIAFSPGGKYVATGGGDGTVQLWNVTTHHQAGAPMVASNNHGVVGLAFSSDGKILATAGADGTVRLWDVATHHGIGPPIDVGTLRAVALTADGKTVATAGDDGMARLWDVATHRQIEVPMAASHPGGVNGIAFSPDGKTLATAGDDGSARLWGIAVYRQVGSPIHTGSEQADGVVFARGGKILATAGADGKARLWDVATHRQIGAPLTVSGPGQTDGIAFSPDGTILASIGDAVRMWSVASHSLVEPLMSSSGIELGSGIAFDPRAKILATAGSDVRLWDIITGRQLGTTIDAAAAGLAVNAVTFSPDGKLLATADDDGTARLWDVTTHGHVGTPIQAGLGGVFGSSGLSGRDGVSAVAFSPDGGSLATASADGTARLWDVATHRQIGASLTASSRGGVLGVAFSPDGKLLATTGGDQTVQLWNVAFPADLVDAMCSISGRSITHQEWNAYVQSASYQKVC